MHCTSDSKTKKPNHAIQDGGFALVLRFNSASLDEDSASFWAAAVCPGLGQAKEILDALGACGHKMNGCGQLVSGESKTLEAQFFTCPDDLGLQELQAAESCAAGLGLIIFRESSAPADAAEFAFQAHLALREAEACKAACQGARPGAKKVSGL